MAFLTPRAPGFGNLQSSELYPPAVIDLDSSPSDATDLLVQLTKERAFHMWRAVARVVYEMGQNSREKLKPGLEERSRQAKEVFQGSQVIRVWYLTLNVPQRSQTSATQKRNRPKLGLVSRMRNVSTCQKPPLDANPDLCSTVRLEKCSYYFGKSRR